MFFHGCTDVGLRRAENQDNFIIKKYSDEVIAAVVCDGMGGVFGGSIASSIAAEAFQSQLDNCEATYRLFAHLSDEEIEHILLSAAEEANYAVYKAGQADMNLSGMGTTLVGCIAMPHKIYTVNVGDSRMYMDAGDGLFQITHDHSVVQYLMDTGALSKEEARKSRRRNVITRAVGTDRTVDADFFITEYDDGAVVLLCSDGLTNHVEETDLGRIINKAYSETGVVSACDELIASANRGGGTDNITAVVMAFPKVG